MTTATTPHPATTLERTELTDLMDQMARGDQDAEARLHDRTFSELFGFAQWRIRRGPWSEMTANSLLAEAYLRLKRTGPDRYHNRSHYFACYRLAMWEICVEQARKLKARQKRAAVLPLDTDLEQPSGVDLIEVLAMEEAIDRLARVRGPRRAQIVRMRFVEGWTIQEIATDLGVCKRTVVDDWRHARAWLRRELGRLLA